MKTLLASAAITIAVFSIVLISCTKNSSVKSSSIFVDYSNYHNTRLDEKLKFHNTFMLAYINKQVIFKSKQEMINYVSDQACQYFHVPISKEFTDFVNQNVLPENFNYEKSMFDVPFNKNRMEAKLHQLFKELDNEMQSKSLESDSRIQQELNLFMKEKNYEINELSEEDRTKFLDLIQIVKNSSALYEPYYNEHAKTRVSKFSKCISSHIWQIILADGVGSLAGAVGCAVLPVSCPAIIAALIAIGSAGPIATFCG